MNGNKKIVKKIVAGSMAVMMAAGLAGTYEYHSKCYAGTGSRAKGQRHSGIKRDCGKCIGRPRNRF